MSKTFNAPYAGAGALMPIKGDTALSSFSGKELAESSAIHGDFNQASINYSGHQNLEVRGAETFAARGTYNLYKSQEKVLKAYRDSGGKENHYDSLPPKIVNKLESIRNSETLWSDVNRWLWDNPSTSKNPYGGFHSTWDAESFGAELTPRFIPVEVIKYDAWWSRKYGREYNPTLVGNDYDYSYVVCVRDIPIAHFDTKENAENHANTVRTAISVLGGVTPSTIDHPLALKEMLADWDVSVDKLTHQKQTFHVKDKDYESQAKRKALSLAKKKKGGWKNYPEGAGFATPEYEAWFARRARAESFGAEGYGPYAFLGVIHRALSCNRHTILLGETSEDDR